MESIKEVLSGASPFSRFHVFHTKGGDLGRPETLKTVGMAYLPTGGRVYTLRLWTFLGERYYIVAKRHDPQKYYLMTREPNRTPNAKHRFFWNIVGHAHADTTKGVLVLEFDLFDQPIYMNLFPEKYSHSSSLPAAPEGEPCDQAA